MHRLASAPRAPRPISASTGASVDEHLVRGAHGGKSVVFDLDNTLLTGTRGDIGEGVFERLSRQGRLRPLPLASGHPQLDSLSQASAQDHQLLYERAVLLSRVRAYERILEKLYPWMTAVMHGLNVSEVIDATERAWLHGEASGALELDTRMHQLLAQCIKLGYRVYVISASPVWTVRWVVQEKINPLLRDYGAPSGIDACHIYGMSTYLQDSEGSLYADRTLVRYDSAYRSLSRRRLAAFHLTHVPSPPLTSFSGKADCLLQHIGVRPFLAFGDSRNDHAMLDIADFGFLKERTGTLVPYTRSSEQAAEE